MSLRYRQQQDGTGDIEQEALMAQLQGQGGGGGSASGYGAPAEAPPMQASAAAPMQAPAVAPIQQQQWTRQNVGDTLRGYTMNREGIDKAVAENPWLGQQVGTHGGKIKDIHGSGEIWDVAGKMQAGGGTGTHQVLTGHTARDAAAANGGIDPAAQAAGAAQMAGMGGGMGVPGSMAGDAVQAPTDASTYQALMAKLQQLTANGAGQFDQEALQALLGPGGQLQQGA